MTERPSAPRSHAAAAHAIPPETWFFRYPESFEHLRRHAESMRGAAPLRVASLGCASGPEAFSVAAALEGVAEVKIVAVDLNEAEIEAGRAGRLRLFTVRGDPPTWCREPWVIEDGAVMPRASLRNRVEFVVHDVLDPALADTIGRFDIILCRNVLIYLDEIDRRQLGRSIDALLKPGGWLYLGHAEQPSALALPWRGGAGAAFAFQAPTATSVPAPTRESAPERVVTPRPDERPESVAQLGGARPFEAIRMLADSGRTDDALCAAQSLHHAGERSAELHELLGTLELGAGRLTDAEHHFRAALYLDPTLEHASLQLRLLAARRDGFRASDSPELREHRRG